MTAGRTLSSLKSFSQAGIVFSTIGSAARGIGSIADTMSGGSGSVTPIDGQYDGKPTGLAQGLQSFASGVAQGVVGGVAGVFVKPVEGAMEGGALGFAAGIGQGIVGVAANPLASVATGIGDVASGIADEVHNIGVAKCAQVRQPRWIALDGHVPAYDAFQALGQARLAQMLASDTVAAQQLQQDELDAYIECGDIEIFVTDQHVLHVHADTIRWYLAIHQVRHVDHSASHVVFHCEHEAPQEVDCGEHGAALVERIQQALHKY